ncbi:MAG: hypothetical protein J0I07_37630, partial [Myxococcales bacterium]|nr:hypothetical protein [Myxococcales bacterium]
MNRFLPRALSIASLALLAFVSARLIARDVRFVAVVLVVAVAFVVPAWLARRRMRQLLLSGDISRIVGTWQSSFRKVTQPETMAPLVTATAYAAAGSATVASPDLIGFSASACRPPLAESWLVAGASTTGAN